MTQSLISVGTLREIFAIDEEIEDPRFRRALASAARQLRTWVGDDAYDDALKTEPVDPNRQEDLELAAAHLTMHFAVLGINTALRPTGIAKTEKVEGNVVIQYHSPKEIAELQERYWETARAIAEPYVIVDESTVEPFGIAVVSEDSNCEGVTRTRTCC